MLEKNFCAFRKNSFDAWRRGSAHIHYFFRSNQLWNVGFKKSLAKLDRILTQQATSIIKLVKSKNIFLPSKGQCPALTSFLTFYALWQLRIYISFKYEAYMLKTYDIFQVSNALKTCLENIFLHWILGWNYL